MCSYVPSLEFGLSSIINWKEKEDIRTKNCSVRTISHLPFPLAFVSNPVIPQAYLLHQLLTGIELDCFILYTLKGSHFIA